MSQMYINISYKFHRIRDTQSRFITKVHDLLGQPWYVGPNYSHANYRKNHRLKI